MASCAGVTSPGRFEGIADLIHNKIEETDGRFLIGRQQEEEVANWSSLFEGSRALRVQKSVPSVSSSPIGASASNSGKKRRAPPPPPTGPPPPASRRPPPPPHQEKENVSRPATRSKTGRPSLDAKFSAIIQQLQRNNGGSRKNAPLGVLDVRPPGPPQPEADDTPVRGSGPGPTPRRRSFRERMNLKAL